MLLISVLIRQKSDDLSYLAMNDLAAIVDKKNPDGTNKDKSNEAFLLRDSNEYKPMRDAVAHTALLTVVAKNRLSLVYENIKDRVIKYFLNPNCKFIDRYFCKIKTQPNYGKRSCY